MNVSVYFLIGIIAALLCFTITVLILKKLIPFLKSKKMGQKILDIGPRWHMSKEGTPTMGGLSFIISFSVVYILYAVLCFAVSRTVNRTLAATVVFAILNGVIGIIDDRAKLMKKANEGLTAWQKYLLQLVLTVIYLLVLRFVCYYHPVLVIPFTDKVLLNGGFLWYLIMVILITGIVNSVNLADGIDGLASGETAAVALYFIACGLICSHADAGIAGFILLGATLGFLVYNFNPARVFMGDTGSLFLGALVVGIAIVNQKPLIILLVGFMYVLESISDILQVGYFKLTHGKRLFKMAPIHHHFEKCGWSERKIFTVFTVMTLIFAVIALIFDTKGMIFISF